MKKASLITSVAVATFGGSLPVRASTTVLNPIVTVDAASLEDRALAYAASEVALALRADARRGCLRAIRETNPVRTSG